MNGLIKCIENKCEPDGIRNGGLGRCSILPKLFSNPSYPAYGRIRYRYGMFKQKIDEFIR